ncbi:Arginine--tRNA ligase [uncultured Desulfobacterium sp.]|uniref:Arginine--tRNA ligase n=1 Tax=uncultured Desulfobacterium sp. TaxID=201089 RepID=A0A445MVA4_9BACT|nr:Arginine--tRNA ligase [uncultured Desulfobacterium sp.]
MKEKLNALLIASVDNCFNQGALKKTALPEFVIEIPNNPEHGHFATNLPMAFASSQKRPPREIASIIIKGLVDPEGLVEKAEVAGPGFINFRIRDEQWLQGLSQTINLDGDYGRSMVGKGQNVLVEFVSANPTGPLHVGHGRGAALGDTLCRILAFCGYDVLREFYINDAGQQLRMLGESVYSRFKQMDDPSFPFPEKGYHGDYVMEVARKVSDKHDLNIIGREEAIRLCAESGKDIMFEEIRETLKSFGVSFDNWYSEKDLFNSGILDRTLDTLREEGRLYEHEGAEWIRTTDFGDDKDRVIRKNDGNFTYFASDISYHLEKHKRGFSRAINLWGADHHGYVPRIKAALLARGIPENWLSILLIQLVKLWKAGQEMKMSKRAGSFVTLRELIDEVGVDAVRFVFLTKNHDSPLDFDMDIVKKQDSENPVYYVQYAHARICSIFRKAEEDGIFLPEKSDAILRRLVLDQEKALIRTMAVFPSLLVDIARSLESHRLTYYLTDLAASFHRYFNLGTKNPEYRVVTQDIELSQARLFLVKAIRIVIANGLGLMGVSAPQKM